VTSVDAEVEAAQQSGQGVPVRRALLVDQRAGGEQDPQYGPVTGLPWPGDFGLVPTDDRAGGRFGVQRVGLPGMSMGGARTGPDLGDLEAVGLQDRGDPSTVRGGALDRGEHRATGPTPDPGPCPLAACWAGGEDRGGDHGARAAVDDAVGVGTGVGVDAHDVVERFSDQCHGGSPVFSGRVGRQQPVESPATHL